MKVKFLFYLPYNLHPPDSFPLVVKERYAAPRTLFSFGISPSRLGRTRLIRSSVEMPKEKRLVIDSNFDFSVILGLDPRIQNKKIFFPWIPGQAGDDRKKDSSTGSE
jgi:hypothetical protein